MKRNLFYSFAILFVALIVFNSCTKNEISNIGNDDLNQPELNYENLTIIDMPEVMVYKGILCFKNNVDFNKYMAITSKMSFEERRNLENEIGFLSQQNIFDQIIDAEKKLDEPYENLSEEEIKNIKVFPPLHSELYNLYLQNNIIKEYYKGTNDEYYGLSTSNPILAPVLNIYGIFAIGKNIYQITENSEKMLSDGDFSKLDLLMKSEKNNEEENIIVISLDGNEKWTSYLEVESPWVESGTGKKGDKRIKIKLYFHSLCVNETYYYYRTYHNVFVECEERNWLRIWKKVATEVTLSGNWYYSEPNNYYVKSYSQFFPSANHIQTSISPYTGAVSPYETYWTWTGPSSWSAGLMKYAHWSATRPGVSGSLTATINYE